MQEKPIGFGEKARLDEETSVKGRRALLRRLVQGFLDWKKHEIDDGMSNIVGAFKLQPETKNLFLERVSTSLNDIFNKDTLCEELEEQLEFVRQSIIQELTDDLFNDVVIPVFHILGLQQDQFTKIQIADVHQELAGICNDLIIEACK